MALQKVVAAINDFFETVLDKNGRVIEVKADEDGWSALMETVEENDYMRKIARDDLIAVYEVHVDQNYDVSDYSRKSVRSRKEAA
jgi:hypothetical protein